jgi:hypothetical protein
MQTVSLYDEGIRFFHDPDLHYEITADNSVRVDPASGQCVMYLGMRDYIKDGERMRKRIELVSGPRMFFIEPIDRNGNRKWDGVVNITWERKGEYAAYNHSCITDPEKISEHYDPDTAMTNDGTAIRTAFVFAYDTRAQYVIKKDGAGDRYVSAYNTTTVVLNQNEYICSVSSGTSDVFLKTLQSGRENALKITITFDLAYDFTEDQRGVNLFTMSDAIAQITERRI